MDLQIIREFVVLSEILNYARAADELYTTQASLSRHIISLEKELGKPLFYRTTRKVELTEFGFAFLPFAKRFTQTYEECQAYLLTEASSENNHVVVGIPGPLLNLAQIKDAFMRFSFENPDYNIELLQDNEEDRLLEKLRKRECDLIVLREPSTVSDSFQRVTISPAEPMCVMLPKSHLLAGEKCIPLELLKDEHFILPPPKTFSYRLFVERCHQLGFEPKMKSSLRGMEIAASMASNGVGLPVMSRFPAEFAKDSTVSVVEISPPIYQEINIIYPKLTKISAATEQILNYFYSKT